MKVCVFLVTGLSDEVRGFAMEGCCHDVEEGHDNMTMMLRGIFLVPFFTVSSIPKAEKGRKDFHGPIVIYDYCLGYDK